VDSEVLTGMNVNDKEEATWNTPAGWLIEGLVRARYK